MRVILHYAKKLIDLSSLTTGALGWQFNTAKDTSISAHPAGTASEYAELRTMLMVKLDRFCSGFKRCIEFNGRIVGQQSARHDDWRLRSITFDHHARCCAHHGGWRDIQYVPATFSNFWHILREAIIEKMGLEDM